MIEFIEVKRDQDPRIAVQCGGLILCNHAVTMRQSGKDFWSMEDDNVGDKNPQDLDTSPQTDQHPIAEALREHDGTVILRWSVDIAALQSSGELYDVSISILMNNDFKILGHYRHSDDGFDPLTSVRHETGFAILSVS